MCQNNIGCNNEVPCTPSCKGCAVLISSDCVNNFTEDLQHSGIGKGQTLTEVFVQFDEYLNNKIEEVSYISLVNTGTGSQIYKGISPIGKKQIRTLLGSSLINLSQNLDDITISANTDNLGTFIRDNQKTYSISNVGVGSSIYKDSSSLLNNTQFNLKKLKSSDNSITIIEGVDDINFSVVREVYQAGTGISIIENVVSNTSPDQVVSIIGGGATTVSGTYPNFSISTLAPDGSETKITASTNVTITGAGTVASPYVISATDTNTTYDGSETKLTAGSNVTITGSGTVASPYTINASGGTVIDGSETKLEGGVGISITGAGTTPSPYVISLETPAPSQRTLNYPADFPSGDYQMSNNDINKLIYINNGANDVTITVPINLYTSYFAAYIQLGTGSVTFLPGALTVLSANGYKIKGQNYQVAFDKVDSSSNTFCLTGNTKV